MEDSPEGSPGPRLKDGGGGVMVKVWLPQGVWGQDGVPCRGSEGKEQTHRILDGRDSVGAALSLCPEGLSLQLPTPPQWVPSPPPSQQKA